MYNFTKIYDSSTEIMINLIPLNFISFFKLDMLENIIDPKYTEYFLKCYQCDLNLDKKLVISSNFNIKAKIVI